VEDYIMETPTPLITQEMFVQALATGIEIPAETRIEQFEFGERLIRWINASDNVYWAAWDPEHDDRVIMDMRNCELMQLWISHKLVSFRRIEPDVEHDMAKEFGNGAIGIILFCMLENDELEEFDLAEIVAMQANENVKESPETDNEPGPDPDFDWI
jgi:hypothetical protein